MKDLVIGTGTEITTDSIGYVHYVLTLDNGKVDDSSRDRLVPNPTKVQLTSPNMIAGFREGVRGMKVGGRRIVDVPPALGYGNKQQGELPPNSWLHFDLELVDVKPVGTPAPVGGLPDHS